MTKATNLKVVEPLESDREPGIVALGDGRLRVTFDINATAKVKIRKDRVLTVDYTRFSPKGLALQFDYGTRAYNDAIGSIKEDDRNDKGVREYADRAAFLAHALALAQKKLDAFEKGEEGRTRDTSGDPVEREMLVLGFTHFRDKKWTQNRCPTVPGVAERPQDFSAALGQDGKPDYGVFKGRVEAFLRKYDVVFRRDAEAAIAQREARAAEIAALAQGHELAT